LVLKTLEISEGSKNSKKCNFNLEMHSRWKINDLHCTWRPWNEDSVEKLDLLRISIETPMIHISVFKVKMA
jgi:hypothetical protein